MCPSPRDRGSPSSRTPDIRSSPRIQRVTGTLVAYQESSRNFGSDQDDEGIRSGDGSIEGNNSLCMNRCLMNCSFLLFPFCNPLTFQPLAMPSDSYISLSNPICFHSSNINYILYFLLSSDKTSTLDLSGFPLTRNYPYLSNLYPSTSHYPETSWICSILFICLEYLDCNRRQVQYMN